MLHGVTKHMPEGKIYQVMVSADANRDRHLAYDEFVAVVRPTILQSVQRLYQLL